MRRSPLLLIVLTTHLLLINAKIKPGCNGVEIRGKYHEKQVLANGLNRPYQLAYYKHEKKLFFSQNVGNDTEDRFEIRYLPHKTAESKPIDEQVEDGFTIAIDESNHVAYFGGSNGIIKRWLKTGISLNLIGKYNIWDMFFKKHLYFIKFKSQKLYELEESEKDVALKGHQKTVKKAEKVNPKYIKWIDGRVYQFAIDGEDDIFITNSTGLYLIEKSNKTHPVLMKGEETFRAIEINNKGEAYFAGKNAIFVPYKRNHTLHKIAEVKNIFGLTFDDNDNIIYSDPIDIVRLMPSECTGTEPPFVPIPIPT